MNELLRSPLGRALIRFVRVVAYGAIAGGALAGGDAAVVELSPIIGTSLAVALTGILVAVDKWARARSEAPVGTPPTQGVGTPDKVV